MHEERFSDFRNSQDQVVVPWSRFVVLEMKWRKPVCDVFGGLLKSSHLWIG